MTFVLETAQKEQAKARWIIEGPAGSGKTRTALEIGSGLGDTIALIDTVQRQSLVFADRFNFDVLHMSANFHPDQLVEALAECSAYDVTIVDTWSSFWSGTGGMLDAVRTISAGQRGGEFSNGWNEMKPVERRMIEAMLGHPGHLIATLRVKTEWAVELDPATGKYGPRKLGTKPEQRADVDYEFGIVSTLDQQHTLRFWKSPYDGFDGRAIEKPDIEVGIEYRLWLEAGKEVVSTFALRDRAFEAKTLDEMRELRAQVVHLNRYHAPVKNEHGDPSTLGAIIDRLGAELKRAEEKGAGK
jgi:hypothetical protein